MTKRQRRNLLIALGFLSPWLIGFIWFRGGAVIASLVISFTEWNMFNPPEFVGFQNYIKLFTDDPLFWKSLRVTLLYSVVVVPASIVFAFTIAMILNQRLKGLFLLRTIFYIPCLISGVALAVIWSIILNPDIGFVNQVIGVFGIEGPKWLWDKRWALPGLMMMGTWMYAGNMIIYLAGLQAIPTQLYESVEIDGGNSVHKFFHITIPMMTPILFFQIIMQLVLCLHVFEIGYVMTRGGPENATLFFNLQLYYRAFTDFRMGIACAMAWVLFLIIIGLTIVLFKTSNRWVYYAGERR